MGAPMVDVYSDGVTLGGQRLPGLTTDNVGTCFAGGGLLAVLTVPCGGVAFHDGNAPAPAPAVKKTTARPATRKSAPAPVWQGVSRERLDEARSLLARIAHVASRNAALSAQDRIIALDQIHSMALKAVKELEA